MHSIKIRENKSASDVSSARYYISYAGKGNNTVQRDKSFELLSKLKGNRDILIELKSSLLSMDIYHREKCAIDFLRGVKDLGLSFRSRKVPSKESSSILTKLFTLGQAPKDSYEIIAHVPAATWNDPIFKALIPYNGVMYYVCKEDSDPQKLMDDIFNGQVFDEEKLELFEVFVYDCIGFEQMGIFTNKMDKIDIERKLKC